MTNEIQKQYDRLEDVPSIMLRMKYVYAVPDRHIRYAGTKAFFGTKMAEGLSVHSHGVKMLSLVEKIEDLKDGLNNDTYIDVILQSFPPSYDSFIERLRPPRRNARVRDAGRGRRAREQRSKANDVCMHCQGKGHWKRECPQLLSNPGVGKKQKAKQG
ncbi:UNVERIFIED_CONTAM: hypothetical protein Slati_0901100 [Sesamum latifolium]|uniref:CCHC-type domain-containing protein n=1 Tax=Sesamum latifolium TaxID=2727402 RepID=A0AAW2XNZ0_9LAMI